MVVSYDTFTNVALEKGIGDFTFHESRRVRLSDNMELPGLVMCDPFAIHSSGESRRASSQDRSPNVLSLFDGLMSLSARPSPVPNGLSLCRRCMIMG